MFSMCPLGHLFVLHAAWGPYAHISMCVAASESIPLSTSHSRIHPHLSWGIRVPLPHPSPIGLGVGTLVQAMVPVWEWVPLRAIVVKMGSPDS